MQSLPLSCSGFDTGREAEALLVAEHAGGRTILRRQYVGYPLHVTRAFTRSPTFRPGDPLPAVRLRRTLRRRSAEARSGRGTQRGAQPDDTGRHGRSPRPWRLLEQRQVIKVKDGAFCAIVTDPYVLFPGACLSLKSSIEVAADGILIWRRDLRFTIRCRMVAVSIAFPANTGAAAGRYATAFRSRRCRRCGDRDPVRRAWRHDGGGHGAGDCAAGALSGSCRLRPRQMRAVALQAPPQRLMQPAW